LARPVACWELLIMSLGMTSNCQMGRWVHDWVSTWVYRNSYFLS
jgi:hypothetical protein